jgi:uncharacterized protein YbjQ (UPF0145 family)
MWFFFKKETEADKARKARDAAAVQALNNGEILPRAKHRIQHHMESGARLFSTDMTVKEHILIEECGIQPLGQVMGTCFYRIQNMNKLNRYTGEVYAIAEAHRMARAQAIYRMKKEAELYGADGIVSVRIKSSKADYNSDMVEFTAIGTAVKVHGWEPEDLENGPFTSELSGQEFWQLIHAGYRPVNVVFGICCYYVNSDYTTRGLTLNRGWFSSGNQEIHQWTRGFYDARESAIKGLQDDIAQFGADGCVGMSVDCDIDEIDYEVNDTRYLDLLITITAIGSSIKKMKRPHKEIERKPLTCLNLASKSLVSIVSRTNELRGTIEDDDFDNDYE